MSSKAVQYSQIEKITYDERLEIMNEIYDILSSNGATSVAKAMESSEINGPMHTSRVLKNLANANNNNGVTFSAASFVGAVAGGMVTLGVLKKIEGHGNDKAKWYIIGNRKNINKDMLIKKGL